MKVGIRTEAVQFLEKEYINGILVAVRVHQRHCTIITVLPHLKGDRLMYVDSLWTEVLYRLHSAPPPTPPPPHSSFYQLKNTHRYWSFGALSPPLHLLYGEGGAFSEDGKLSSLKKKELGLRRVQIGWKKTGPSSPTPSLPPPLQLANFRVADRICGQLEKDSFPKPQSLWFLSLKLNTVTLNLLKKRRNTLETRIEQAIKESKPKGADPSPFLAPWSQVEIIWTSKMPPFSTLGQASDIAKPNQVNVSQRFFADVNSLYQRMSRTDSVSPLYRSLPWDRNRY